MTDNETIKGLEYLTYGGNYCLRCEHRIITGDHRCGIDGCHIAKKALDLIKQQKAEIEGLQTVIFKKEDTMQLLHKEHQQTVDELQYENVALQRKNVELQYENLQMIASIKNLKSEAIKEFADRLKEKAYVDDGVTGFQDVIVAVEDIDSLVEEMAVNYESSKTEKQRKEDEKNA